MGALRKAPEENEYDVIFKAKDSGIRKKITNTETLEFICRPRLGLTEEMNANIDKTRQAEYNYSYMYELWG